MNVGVRTAPGVGGTIVVLAAWCSRCRDEVMPNDRGFCSWCGRQVVDLDRLKIRDAIASTNTNGGTPMTATAVGTVWCKREDCNEPAEDRSGPYAKLCATHKQEARDQRASGTPAPRPARSSSGTGGGTSSLADRAKQLVPLAKKLEKARAQLEELPSTTQAKAQFDEATRRASATPTPENLERVVEATKQLQAGAPRRTRIENDVSQAERALGLALQSFVREARTG